MIPASIRRARVLAGIGLAAASLAGCQQEVDKPAPPPNITINVQPASTVRKSAPVDSGPVSNAATDSTLNPPR
jgi:uncharacterized lipoprotein YbaY